MSTNTLRTDPRRYGVKANAKAVTSNVTIGSGSPNLTVAGAAFVASDVGKTIAVPQAGPTVSGVKTTLVTTILSVTDGTHVVLNANASNALSASSQTVVYGTDDTSAMNTALATADKLDLSGLSILVTGLLTQTKAIKIVGDGTNKIYHRQLASGGTCGVFKKNAGVGRLVMEGVNWDIDTGNGSTVSSNIFTYYSGNVLFRDCDFSGGLGYSAPIDYPMMLFRGGLSDFVFDNCNIHDFVTSAYFGLANNLTIRGGSIKRQGDNGQDAVHLVFVDAPQVYTNILLDGLSIDVSTVTVSNAVFIAGNPTYFLDGVTIVNCDIVSGHGGGTTGGGGILPWNINRLRIIGNKIVGTGIGGYEGIGLADIRDCSVIGNYIYNYVNYCIEANGVFNIVISGNVFKSSARGVSIEDGDASWVTDSVVITNNAMYDISIFDYGKAHTGGTFGGAIYIQNKSLLKLGGGITNASPEDGDFWWDGTNFKVRIGGVTKTVTVS